MASGKARTLLVLSTLVYAINVVDRQLLPMLAESVRKDIALTDWQFGLLTGITFAACYAVLTLPLAWMADRGSRRTIVACCLGVFSIATALCGFAQNFWQFATVRTAVAMGEAGTTPATLSMLSDSFPERKGFASGVLTAGAHLGVLVGAIFATTLAATLGWRASFICAGIFGALISSIYIVAVREPERIGVVVTGGGSTYRLAIAQLYGDPRFRWLTVATAGLLFFTNATGAWLPTFLMRAHALTLPQIGLFVGLTAGLTGMLCVLISGALLDRLARRDMRWVAWAPAIVFAIILAATWAGVMTSATAPALVFLAIGPSLQLVIQTGLFTMLQMILPRGLQASGTALLFVVANLIGMGFGPALVGALSTHWASAELSLRPALILGLCPTLIGLYACLRLAALIGVERPARNPAAQRA